MPDTRRVIRLELGSVDVVVSRKLVHTQSARSGGGVRGRITSFTRASSRRLLLTARNMDGLQTLLTLTYPADFPLDGRAVKNHWRRMRQWLVRAGVPYGLWFLEFQERGAPHFHAFLPSFVDYERISQAWYRIVGSGDERHLRAGTQIIAIRKPHAVAAYAAKYASKANQKEVPPEFANVGRFWGTWGEKQLFQAVVVSGVKAAQLVRAIRRAYQAERRSWGFIRKRFRDKGRAGFVAWNVSKIAARLLSDSLIPAPPDRPSGGFRRLSMAVAAME